MSIRIMAKVWSLAIPSGEKFVALALADNASDEGACWPLIATIAKKTSTSPRGVMRHIETLRSMGLLETQTRGHKKSLMYTFNIKVLDDLLRSQSRPDTVSPQSNLTCHRVTSEGGFDLTQCHPEPSVVVEPSDMQQSGEPSCKQDSLEEESESPKGNPPSSPPQECPPPPPTPLTQKPRPRNLLGEAALQACHIDYTKATKSQWGAASDAVKQIKAVYPAVTPQDLLDLGDELRKQWGKSVPSFTPGALSKHWRPPAASGSGLPESTLPELEDKIRACRGFHHHIDHEKATEEEHVEYARLLAKRRAML
jgi:hypothetical protein